MTNKPMLSVEQRELLGKAASLLEIHGDRPSLETCVADDLRALLDAQHVVCSNGILCQNSKCAECGGNGAYKPAAQHQGDPVADQAKTPGPMVLVPREATPRMIEAAIGIYEKDGSYAEMFGAMCDAAPVEIDLTPRRLAHAESVIEQQNNVIKSLRAELQESYGIGVGPRPVLTVWYGSMPESNGKTNWTAILHRKGGGEFPLRDIAGGITIDRSEYRDRVRYEADRMRHLIGELLEEPDILAYDEKLHSGYVKPAPVAVAPETPEQEGVRKARESKGEHKGSNLWGDTLRVGEEFNRFADAYSAECYRLNGVKS